MHRLLALFLAAPDDAAVVAAAAPALTGGVPSHKLTPLVHQCASRLSAAAAGPSVESGFQAALGRLLTRIAVDHPHHALWQLHALRCGARGRDGRDSGGRRAAAAAVSGGLPPSVVDRDKVEAAKGVLDAVGGVSAER